MSNAENVHLGYPENAKKILVRKSAKMLKSVCV